METEQNAYIKRMEESTKAFDIDLLAIVERKKGPFINYVTIFFSSSPGLIFLQGQPRTATGAVAVLGSANTKLQK